MRATFLPYHTLSVKMAIGIDLRKVINCRKTNSEKNNEEIFERKKEYSSIDNVDFVWRFDKSGENRGVYRLDHRC